MGIPRDHHALKTAVEKGLKTTDGRTLADILADREVLARVSASEAQAKAAEHRSVGEKAAAEVAAWCGVRGFPAPTTEHIFARPRRWRFDLAWVDLKVAVEFQGGLYNRGRHVRPAGFAADCEKFSEAAIRGWKLLLATYPQVKDGTLYGWLERVLI